MVDEDFFADDFFDVDLVDVDFRDGDFFVADFFEPEFLLVDFFEVDFVVVDFFELDFFEPDVFDPDLLDLLLDDFAEDFGGGGTFPPSSRASERAMAMACLRLFTFWPDPLRSLPRLSSCIFSSTFSCDFWPYLLAIENPPAQVFVQWASPAVLSARRC